jgi:23S rRNA (guanosine2251-2'-O)-methyltransferase
VTIFEIRECSNAACRLRFPMDPSQHSGAYCPRCGEPMEKVYGSFTNQDCASKNTAPKRKIVALLDNIRSAYNVGAMFRTADGAGLQHLFLCGVTPTPDEQGSLQKTALGAETTLPWSYYPNALHLVEELKKAGNLIVGLECAPNATSIFDSGAFPTTCQPLVLVIGNERAGIDPAVLDRCDLIRALPMAGKKASLNAAVAFGIAAYWLAFS